MSPRCKVNSASTNSFIWNLWMTFFRVAGDLFLACVFYNKEMFCSVFCWNIWRQVLEYSTLIIFLAFERNHHFFIFSLVYYVLTNAALNAALVSFMRNMLSDHIDFYSYVFLHFSSYVFKLWAIFEPVYGQF